MNYKGYNLSEIENGILVENVQDFDPVHTFECGQCFRWKRQADGSYTGIAWNRAVNISCRDGLLQIKNTTIEDFKNIWFEYLDLETDYGKVKEQLCRDEIMRKAVEFGSGIRLLRQEFWETFISFILSSNNNIPRIQKIIETISSTYGEQIALNGAVLYTFPSPEKLAVTSLEELSVCRGGYRCRYIHLSSRMYREEKDVEMQVRHTASINAREILKKYCGVGEKVADCILLYSGLKHDVFPTDTWVQKVMGELYLGKKASVKEIRMFASERFGDLAGYAQQYLFYYAREKRIGLR